MHKLTGIDYNYHTHTFRCGHAYGTDEEFIEQFFSFLYEEDDDFESSVFVFAICLFTSKGTLTVEEQEFLEIHLL